MAGEGGKGLEDLISGALAADELIKKPQEIQTRPQSLLERIIISKWTAPVSAAVFGSAYYLFSNGSLDQSIVFEGSAIIAGLGYITAKLMRQDWLLRKAESVRRKTRPLASKLFNLVPEHPELIAGGIAAYTAARTVSPIFASITPSDLFRHADVIPIALQLSAYSAALSFAAAYSVISLSLGRVFHLETAKTLFNMLFAEYNALNGQQYKKAADKLSMLLETQRSYSKAVALQTLIGDMQMLDGQIGSLDNYINALSTDRTSYFGRSDWVLTYFIKSIRREVEQAKKPKWAEAHDISCVIRAAQLFAEGQGRTDKLKDADTLLRAAVESCRHGLISHVARAAFLRKTGRQATADMEVRISAEITMQQPLELERVTEESRNEVFFSGNLALKRNNDPEPLMGEFALLEKLRKEFGQSVIYPLPVYKAGDFYYSVSERGPETLLEMMRQRKARFEDFAEALSQMAKIQRFGMKLYDSGELRFDDAIRRIDQSKPGTMYFANRRRHAIAQIERFNGITLPESYKDSVINGLAFVDAGLASSELLTMYSDRGPKNWLKQLFGQMQALDFEPKSLKLLPPQMDLVNLLEFAEYLAPMQLQRLIGLYVSEYEKEHRIKIDREEFRRKYEFAGLQWHYERLIYNPEEASSARVPEQREAKKKEQIYHLAKAREHLETIIERGYAEGDSLKAALQAMEELKTPLFADVREWQRLEEAVNAESGEKLMAEPLPPGPARLATASLAALALLGFSTLGFVAVRNNLIPFANVPVFPQGDKILLGVSGERNITRPSGGFQSRSFLNYDLYVINADNDALVFLSQADEIFNADLSAFQDKIVFVKDDYITLYDFITRKFRTVADARFENPKISPTGLWIASNVSMEYRGSNMSELWLIRPADMKTRQAVEIPNAFLSPWSESWSPDGSYLAFLSNNEKDSDGYVPNTMKVWINAYNLSTGEVNNGPFISGKRRGVFEWSGDGRLAYIKELDADYDTERTETRDRVYLTGPDFKDVREVYVAGTRIPQNEREWIININFVGTRHLLLVLSQLKNGKFAKELALLNLETLAVTSIDNGYYFEGTSKDGNKFLYMCNEPFDVCEFDVMTGESRNLTKTSELAETSAVYSPDQKKVYVVSHPEANCLKSTCPPSLFVIDLATGSSKLLLRETNRNLSYDLLVP